MSSLDIYEDGFPHGTVEGYRRGCRSGVCPAREFDPLADSCRQANVRYQGDWEYRRAVDAGVTPPPMVHDKPEKASRSKAGSIISEPVIEVADSFEPLPALDLPKKDATEEKRVRRRTWEHGTITGYNDHRCRTDHECPAFLAGGLSCRQAARQYWREKAEQKRREAGIEPREFSEPRPAEVVSALASNADVDVLIDRAPDGGLVVTIRIPASVVAA